MAKAACRQVLVRDGKGAKDRVTMLPEQAVQPLQAHLGRVRALHHRDLAAGHGEVSLPYALARNTRAPGGNGHGSSSFLPASSARIRIRE
jgi:hypothetical protein